MIAALKQMLPKIESWPPDDQLALLEVAHSIEAERAGVYHASPEELRAIDRGLGEAGEGRFATDEAVASLSKRFRRTSRFDVPTAG